MSAMAGQVDSIPRYNQKNANLADGRSQPGWFYPTPSEVTKKGDVNGNEEAYYPHFLFDSNFTYGMIHRHPPGGWLKTTDKEHIND